jgi:hypothetical protein
MRKPPALAEELDAAVLNPARKILTADELMRMDFPEPRWAVNGIIPEGLGVLAGKPKIGKSWLFLGLGIAIPSGGRAFGTIEVEQGEVLYLALEDSNRRLQSRIKKLLRGEPAPSGLHLVNEWARLDNGGLEHIEGWLDEHPDARMVAIDTWKRIKPPKKGNENVYDADYQALIPLHRLASDRGIAILLAHHQRKADAADWVDTLTGSTGIGAAADTVAAIFRDRARADAVLRITGRDLDEQELALHFDNETGDWLILGDAEEYRLSTERAEIIEVLRLGEGPQTPTEVGVVIDRNYNAVKKLMWQMSRDGQIQSAGGGRYWLPPTAIEGEA